MASMVRCLMASATASHWGMIEVLVNYGAPTLVVLLAALAAGVVWSVRSARRLRIGGDSAGAAVMFGAGVLAVTIAEDGKIYSTNMLSEVIEIGRESCRERV